MEHLHTSVMPTEVLEGLNIKPDQWYLDATLGDAGHTILMLQKGARVWGLDQDREAIRRSQIRLSESLPELRYQIELDTYQPVNDQIKCLLTYSNFENAGEVAKEIKIGLLSGILMDLGVSTMQLLDTKRGFSFQGDTALDMRMDTTKSIMASDLVNKLPETELALMFKVLGDEPRAASIAHKIVQKREIKPIETTQELVEIIGGRHMGHIHPATKVFQALRMAVNSERLVLTKALPQMIEMLKPGGRLVVISFHAGEDRIVKQFLKDQDNKTLQIITNKALKPLAEEVTRNPRARSAKLRVAEKI